MTYCRTLCCISSSDYVINQIIDVISRCRIQHSLVKAVLVLGALSLADPCCSVNLNAENSRQGKQGARDDVSDSEDDKPLSLYVRKKSAVKRLPFGNSLVKHSALVVTQAKGNIHKNSYDPVSNQKQRWSSADRRERIRLDYALHQDVMSRYGCL